MKKVLMISAAAVGAVMLIYIGSTLFFMNHFFINTTINGKDFSAKNIADVEKYLTEEVDRYELVITDANNNKDTIKGSDINLSYEGNEGAKELLERQDAFLWPASFFSNDIIDTHIDISYDKEALANKISELKAVRAAQIPPKSACPYFDGKRYVVRQESIGTAIDKTAFRGRIREKILNFDHELDLKAEGCYMAPKFNADAPEVKRACDEMNKYAKASITYTMDKDVKVDGALISKWLHVDDDMNVIFDEKAVEAWLDDFAETYDTVGKKRKIVTPYKEEKEVEGGTYGWSINKIKEYPVLLDYIKNGKTVIKDPLYYQKAASHSPQDWGKTYAEVDITRQHMWFVKDGQVALETDVVTGFPTKQKETTPGVFDIIEMKKDKILLGEFLPGTKKREYETHVFYWMGVTRSGIGFHDAIWQPGFGGDLYTVNGIGSHGCINMPLDQAEALYGLISMGTPVIFHH